MRTTTALCCAILLAAAGCTTDSHVQPTLIPHVTTEPPPNFEAGYRVSQAYVMTVADDETVGQRLSDFCLAIAAKASPGTSVGCLPVVNYDLRREGPWVSELGLRLADDVAARLKTAGFSGEVLSTPEMDARIQRAGLDKAAFANVTAVSASGPGLGLDVIVFGTVKRENNLGAAGRDVLTLDFSAMEVNAGTLLARDQFEVASDRPGNQTFFELSQRESLWLSQG